MSSGLSILHKIDATIAKARARAGEASALSARAAEAVVELQRKQSLALQDISRARLDILEGGEGGELGYIDRQAAKLLDQHTIAINAADVAARKSEKAVETLEAKRRTQEELTNAAIDAYDKAAAKAETNLLKDANYNAQLDTVERLESTVIRAEEKLELARTDETTKGEPYRNDPFFTYLQNRGYGTREQKGWFLTKWLDTGVARLAGYRQAAENYRRLTAIPMRLGQHVENLQDDVTAAQNALQTLEADWLVSQGVKAKHKASLAAQKKLEAIDTKIAKSEDAHEQDLALQVSLAAGDAGPYKQAISLMADTLAKQNLSSLRRLASQTQTREDDEAVEALRDLSRAREDLGSDQKEAKNLLGQYQRTLSDLQRVRQNFKARRYDAPSSSFKRSKLISALLTEVLAGSRSGKHLWKQIERAQQTSKRYSDTDFGGGDWTEGLRLPRQTRRYRRNNGIDLGDIFGSGGFGGNNGGFGGIPSPRRRSRTSIPRRPRQSLPKISLPRGGGFGGGFGGGRRGGGFKTGGGF